MILQVIPPEHDKISTFEEKVADAMKQDQVDRRVEAFTALCRVHIECLQWWKGMMLLRLDTRAAKLVNHAHALSCFFPFIAAEKNKDLSNHKAYIEQSILALGTEHMKRIQMYTELRKSLNEHR